MHTNMHCRKCLIEKANAEKHFRTKWITKMYQKIFFAEWMGKWNTCQILADQIMILNYLAGNLLVVGSTRNQLIHINNSLFNGRWWKSQWSSIESNNVSVAFCMQFLSFFLTKDVVWKINEIWYMIYHFVNIRNSGAQIKWTHLIPKLIVHPRQSLAIWRAIIYANYCKLLEIYGPLKN